MNLTAIVYSCHKWKHLFIRKPVDQRMKCSLVEKVLGSETSWELSFWLPKRPSVAVGGKSLLFTGKRKVIPGFLLLTGYFESKRKFVFPPRSGAIKMSSKFLLGLYLIFPKEYFPSMLFFVASKYVKRTETWFEKITSESLKLRGRWFAEATFCSCMCTHLWSSFWMEFCAYSSQNLALNGYNVYSSVCLPSFPLDQWV